MIDRAEMAMEFLQDSEEWMLQEFGLLLKLGKFDGVLYITVTHIDEGLTVSRAFSQEQISQLKCGFDIAQEIRGLYAQIEEKLEG